MRDDLSEREAYERYWDSRTKEAELNFHVFVYLGRCVAEGDYQALRDIGCGLEEAAFIEQIRLPDLLALAATRAHALNVHFNRESMPWLREHMRRRRNRETLKTELLRAEAPFELMRQLFGMSAKEYAAARITLGQPSGRGRPALSGERDEQRLWQLWVLFAKPDRPQRLRREDQWLIIGRELDSTVRAAWSVIHTWGQDDNMLRALLEERERLGPAEIEEAERKLRDRHSIFPHDIATRPAPPAAAEPKPDPPEAPPDT